MTAAEITDSEWEWVLAEANRRALAYNSLFQLIHKYQLTKAGKLNKFLGIKNGRDLLSGDLTNIDQDELIRHTGKIISHIFLYGTIDD